MKIRNMRELSLVKQKLKYQEILCEKEIAGASAKLVDNLTDKMKDLAFDLGAHLIQQLISSRHKKKEKEDH